MRLPDWRFEGLLTHDLFDVMGRVFDRTAGPPADECRRPDIKDCVWARSVWAVRGSFPIIDRRPMSLLVGRRS